MYLLWGMRLIVPLGTEILGSPQVLPSVKDCQIWQNIWSESGATEGIVCSKEATQLPAS